MTASAALAKLGDDYWEDVLRESPTYATYLGDFRYNDRLSDLSDAGRARWTSIARKHLDALGRIDRAALPEVEKVSFDILKLQLENATSELSVGLDAAQEPEAIAFDRLSARVPEIEAKWIAEVPVLALAGAADVHVIRLSPQVHHRGLQGSSDCERSTQ